VAGFKRLPRFLSADVPVEDRLVDVGDVLDAVLGAVEQDRARKLTSFAQDAFAIEERLARVVGQYVPEARRTKNAMLSGLRSPPRPTKRPPRDGLGSRADHAGDGDGGSRLRRRRARLSTHGTSRSTRHARSPPRRVLGSQLVPELGKGS